MKNNWKLVALSYGFYFFGEEVDAPEGYIKLVQASMFGGFSGGKGVPGVTRGDKDARVTLDRFLDKGEVLAPLSSVVFVADSINLYESKNTTIR